MAEKENIPTKKVNHVKTLNKSSPAILSYNNSGKSIVQLKDGTFIKLCSACAASVKTKTAIDKKVLEATTKPKQNVRKPLSQLNKKEDEKKRPEKKTGVTTFKGAVNNTTQNAKSVIVSKPRLHEKKIFTNTNNSSFDLVSNSSKGKNNTQIKREKIDVNEKNITKRPKNKKTNSTADIHNSTTIEEAMKSIEKDLNAATKQINIEPFLTRKDAIDPLKLRVENPNSSKNEIKKKIDLEQKVEPSTSRGHRENKNSSLNENDLALNESECFSSSSSWDEDFSDNLSSPGSSRLAINRKYKRRSTIQYNGNYNLRRRYRHKYKLF